MEERDEEIEQDVYATHNYVYEALFNDSLRSTKMELGVDKKSFDHTPH